MNRYKNLISNIVGNQEKLITESKIGTVFNEGYTSYDAHVESVNAAYGKIYKRLKYLCPIKKFESTKGIPVIYTGFVTTFSEMYPQNVCVCEWQDESLPKIVIITETFGSPETILKRAYGQEPISVKAYSNTSSYRDEETNEFIPDEYSFKKNPEIAKYKLDKNDIEHLEAQGCKFNHNGGTAVEMYWIKYVDRLDKKNKESRKQEWLAQQDKNYKPEVKAINVYYHPDIWTIKTGFKFVSKSEETTKFYGTVWQDAEGNLFGKEGNEYWAPGCIQLWSENPEKLDMNNVKEGVEQAVNEVIKNRSWNSFTFGRYHNYRGGYDTDDMPKLPVKLIKW